MPWNIILIFFFLGIIAGVNSNKKDRKRKTRDGAEEA